MAASLGMSDEELAAYRGYFWKQDTSGDGRLNIEEFQKMMVSMGVKLNAREIRKAFNTADTDRSGSITFNEFAQTFLNKQNQRKSSFSQHRLQEVFRQVDKDRDGSLTKEECIHALKMLRKNLNDQGITRIMEIMDKNNDGGISFEEFCRFLEL